MDKQKIKGLVEKFYEGQTSLEEERLLRRYFRQEQIPDELKSEAEYFRYAGLVQRESAPSGFDPFSKLDARTDGQKVTQTPFPGEGRKWVWSLRAAAGFILLIIGFAAGQIISDEGGASGEQLAALRQDVEQMKEALMYGTQYSQASAGERLSAVKMTGSFATENNGLDRQITDILVYTMNNDKNVNVRMAAAEALFRFREEPQVRKALVNALGQQEDPQMQLTIIDMLVRIKARGALNEMNKLLMDSDTREIVRERLRTGIAELKT